MHHRSPTQVKEIFAQTTIARSPSLPASNMGQGMLDRDPLPQFGPSYVRQLPLAQLAQEGFIGVNADAASTRTGGTAFAQRTGCTGLRGKLHRSSWLEGQVYAVGTAT